LSCVFNASRAICAISSASISKQFCAKKSVFLPLPHAKSKTLPFLTSSIYF